MKGQSAIEYLMTYGWMLLVVAIAGGAIYSTVGDQAIETVSGFNGDNIMVSDFSLTDKQELQLLIKNKASEDVEINSIELTEDNKSIKINGGISISSLDEITKRIDGLQSADETNDIDMKMIYSQGVLENLSVSGTLTGNLEIVESYQADWWWDEEWESRKPVYIQHNGERDLENFQVKINLDTEELISSSTLKDGCSDIRFLSSKNSNQYDYWVENGCNSNSTSIWVEVPEIKSAQTKKFYVYFNNPNASSNSSAEDTMFIYDLHGNGHEASLNERAEYNSTQEYVDLTPDLAYRGSMMYEEAPRPGFVAEFRHYAGGGSGADATYLSAYSTDSVIGAESTDNGDYKYSLDEYSGNTLQINYDGNENQRSANPAFNIDDSTWRNVTVKFNGNNRHVIEASGDRYIDTEISESKEDSGDYFGWGARTGGSNNYHRVRNLTVRKYVEPAPEVSTGNIQKR